MLLRNSLLWVTFLFLLFDDVIVCELTKWDLVPYSESSWNPLTRQGGTMTRLVGTNDYFIIGGDDGTHFRNDVFRSSDHFYSFSKITDHAAFPPLLSGCAGSILSADGTPLLLLFDDNHPPMGRLWFSNDGGFHWFPSGFEVSLPFRSEPPSTMKQSGCVMTNKETEFLLMILSSDSTRNIFYRFSSSKSSSVELIESYDAPFPWRIRAAMASSNALIFITGGLGLNGSIFRRHTDSWLSVDSGRTWSLVNANYHGLSDASCVMIYGTIYVLGGFPSFEGFNGGENRVFLNAIWKSINGGKEWKLISWTALGRTVDNPFLITDSLLSTVYFGGGDGEERNLHFKSSIPLLPPCPDGSIWGYSSIKKDFDCIDMNDTASLSIFYPHIVSPSPPLPSAGMGVIIPSLMIQLFCTFYAMHFYRSAQTAHRHPNPISDPSISADHPSLTLFNPIIHQDQLKIVRQKSMMILLIGFIISPIFIILGYFNPYGRYCCIFLAAMNCMGVFLLYRYLRQFDPVNTDQDLDGLKIKGLKNGLDSSDGRISLLACSTNSPVNSNTTRKDPSSSN